MGESVSLVARQEEVDSDAFNAFLDLVVERIGGLRELLGVTSSTENKFSSTWVVFSGGDPAAVERITYRTFGFVPSTAGGLAFGLGFGLWGTLALSGSSVVVFLGSLLTMLMLTGIEEIFNVADKGGQDSPSQR